MPASYDVLTTIAFAAAILVAVSGGLLAVQVATLAGDKRRLIGQVAAAEGGLLAISQRRDKLRGELETTRVRLHLDQFVGDIAERDPLPSFEEARLEHPAADLDQDVFRQEYESDVKAIVQARRFVNEHHDQIGDEYSLDLWLARHNLDPDGCNLGYLDIAYEHAWRQVQENRVRQEERQQRQRLWPLWIASELLGSRPSALPSAVEEGPDPQWERERRKRVAEELFNLQAGVNDLERQVDGARAHLDTSRQRLDAFRYPAELERGFWAIAFLAVAGIVFPLLLAPVSATLSWLPWVAVGLFTLGLGGLFWSLYEQIRWIKRPAAL